MWLVLRWDESETWSLIAIGDEAEAREAYDRTINKGADRLRMRLIEGTDRTAKLDPDHPLALGLVAAYRPNP